MSTIRYPFGDGTFGENTSELNSSTTPLGISETFTGDWEHNSYPDAFIMCKTDAVGTLYFDFSPDGINVDSTFPTSGLVLVENVSEIHIAKKAPRYFRVRLVNNSAAQTYLRLTTYYGSFGQLSAPLNQAVSLDSDSNLSRPSDFNDEVRQGKRLGVDGWNKFGYRLSLTSAGGEEFIAAQGGNLTILATASTFTITYNSATDGLGNTGATQLYFYYIDANGLPVISQHTLGNTGSDVTSFSGLGINRCVVSANGGASYNTNNITITATTGGSTQAFIPALQSVTQQCVFFLGSNHRAIVKWLYIKATAVTKTAVIAIKGYVYNRQFGTRYEVYRDKIDTSVELTIDLTDPLGFTLNPTDVLYFVADSSSNNVDIACRFSLTQYQQT